MCYRADWYISPAIIQFWEERGKIWGPIAAGALFGAGWWFWVDAVVCASQKIPFDHYLPGIIATLALLMINCIRRDELLEVDPFDDATICRSRLWLFLSYVVSFGAVVAAVWIMIATKGPDKWTGAAGILQVCSILGSGLLFFVSRTPIDGVYSGYGSF